MAIKQQQSLTKGDFEAALVTLRLSVSEVARETSIPRHQVSHFRNYGDGLKPEQLAKLRDYLEDKGIEFTEEGTPETPETPQTATETQPVAATVTLPRILTDEGLTQRTALVSRHFFVDERITDEQIAEAGERIQESFAKAKELLEVELVTSWGSFDEATETRMRELWGHLARIGLVSLHMQGRVLIDQDRVHAGILPEEHRPEPKTLGDLLANTYRGAVTGLQTEKQSAAPVNQPETKEETA